MTNIRLIEDHISFNKQKNDFFFLNETNNCSCLCLRVCVRLYVFCEEEKIKKKRIFISVVATKK